MLRITPQARAELHEMLGDALGERADAQERARFGFRVVIAAEPARGAAVGLTVDAVREGDDVFDHEGAHVLLVDGAAREAVEDLVLEVEEEADGRRRLRVRIA